MQTAFNNLILEFENVQNEEYTRVIDQINCLGALMKKAGDSLNARKVNPVAPPEIDSEIEEQIGYVWKLTDLVALGLCEEHAELLQLAFNVYDNPARREFVDMGIWFNLKSGNLYTTKNYRPYKASKHIKEGDSFMDVALLPELFAYPGGFAPRIRWEENALDRRKRTTADLGVVHAHATTDYAALFKRVRSSIKNPLADKNPPVLLALTRSFTNGEHLAIEDQNGTPLTLRDLPGQTLSATTVLRSFLPADCTGLSLLVMLDNNVTDGLFTAQPMTLVTPEKGIRLFY